MTYKRLGDLLLSEGLVTEADIDRALTLQKGSGKRLGTVMIEAGIISEPQLIAALEAQLGIDFIDLSKTILPPELVQYVPKSIAKRHNVVPVRMSREGLILAMSDPLNFMAIEDVKRVAGQKVVPVISTSDAVERAIISLYGSEGAARAIEEMRREAGDDVLMSPSVMTTDVSAEDEVSAAPTVRLVNSIIERAATERASDIHIEPRDSEIAVRLRVDGVLRNVLSGPSALQNSVSARLKVMAGMNTSERKIPQDGRANVRVKDRDIDLRISTLPTIYGEKLVIRLLDKTSLTFSSVGIGMDEHNIQRYDHLMRNKSGVILISGPTGSGKSSTMTTMVRDLNTEEVNIVTLEDPVEYDIDGVNQVQINEKTGMTFASGLRSILRQDPDIISVGEIRDTETAEIAMRAAVTGHLVLSTIHTNDAVSTLDRLFDIGVEPYLTSSALKGVLAQRLVRKICPNCRTAYEPTDEELDLLDMERRPGMQFYKGNGCPMCYHTGYIGRTGVFEILMINNTIRRQISARAGYDEVLASAREDGFVTIAERCRTLVLEGVTSAKEAAVAIHSTEM